MILLFYYFLLTVMTVYSFGFIDRSLPFTAPPFLLIFQRFLGSLVYENRIWAGLIYILLIIGMYCFYIYYLKNTYALRSVATYPKRFFLIIIIILFLSFPAFSYDIFNYLTTAKVTYFYKENPYIVMPVEIPNEPWLAFTRAANKVALYGPTWIIITYLPFLLGMGKIFLTIYAFKFVAAVAYIIMLYLIFRETHDMKNVLFFGLNPLILTEVLVAAHNDIIMMDLAVVAFLFLSSRKLYERFLGLVLCLLSVFVKGATFILIPLILFKRYIKISYYEAGFWLMLVIFFLSPLREELYPWYAVWYLSFASLLSFKKHTFIHSLSVILSFGLSLRHLPYILTREYGGLGPALRMLFTFLPLVLFGFYWFFRKLRKA